MFEPSAYLWRGRPYRPDLDSVLVNASLAIVSIRHLDSGATPPGWGRSAPPAQLDDLLVPRALYGEHLAGTALGVLREQGWWTWVAAARCGQWSRSSKKSTL